MKKLFNQYCNVVNGWFSKEKAEPNNTSLKEDILIRVLFMTPHFMALVLVAHPTIFILSILVGCYHLTRSLNTFFTERENEKLEAKEKIKLKS